METFIKTSYEAIKTWILEVFTLNGFINGGWLIGAVFLWFFGYPLFSGLSLGIFAEKNRRQLVILYKKIKGNIIN